MTLIFRGVLLSFILSSPFSTGTLAADQAAPAAAAAKYAVGDTVYVCGCAAGKGCGCNTLQASPGKCHCGSDLVQGTVTKVTEGAVTVKTAGGEQVVTLK